MQQAGASPRCLPSPLGGEGGPPSRCTSSGGGPGEGVASLAAGRRLTETRPVHAKDRRILRFRDTICLFSFSLSYRTLRYVLDSPGGRSQTPKGGVCAGRR
jgi:hypothetical protein